MALIWSMASCSAWIEPVSLMAMVPVAECNWPTVTSVSVTASPVVFTLPVGGLAPWAARPGRPAPATGSGGEALHQPAAATGRRRDPFCCVISFRYR